MRCQAHRGATVGRGHAVKANNLMLKQLHLHYTFGSFRVKRQRTLGCFILIFLECYAFNTEKNMFYRRCITCFVVTSSVAHGTKRAHSCDVSVDGS